LKAGGRLRLPSARPPGGKAPAGPDFKKNGKILVAREGELMAAGRTKVQGRLIAAR